MAEHPKSPAVKSLENRVVLTAGQSQKSELEKATRRIVGVRISVFCSKAIVSTIQPEARRCGRGCERVKSSSEK